MNELTAHEFLSRDYQHVVFAGGGNRCWWQAGFIEQLSQHRCWQAVHLIGASAGAGIATAFSTGRIQESLQSAMTRFAATPRNIEWLDLFRGQRPFMLPRIYPDWISSFLSAEDFDRLKVGDLKIDIVVTRPLRFVPLSISTSLALLLYSTEKYWLKHFHGRLPHRIGFRSEYLDIRTCDNLEAARTLLLGSGAAVPITPVHQVNGRSALDGGFYDSVPLPQSRLGDPNTLILLTRHRPDLPQIFTHQQRVYIQPKSRLRAINMDCTSADNVLHTYLQGQTEGRALLGA